MDSAKLLAALEQDEAEMREAEARRGKGIKRQEEASKKDEPVPKAAVNVDLWDSEDLEKIKELEDGGCTEVKGGRVWKVGDTVLDNKNLDSILSRACDILAEHWLLTCYPCVGVGSSAYYPEYIKGMSLGDCLANGAAMRVVYSKPRSMEELEASFDFGGFLWGLKRAIKECAESGRPITACGAEGVAYVSSEKIDTVALDMVMQYAVFGELTLT